MKTKTKTRAKPLTWPRPCTCQPGLEQELTQCKGAASCLYTHAEVFTTTHPIKAQADV